jgi:hypothetical protein
MSPRRPLLLALGAWWLLALAAAFWPPLFPAWQLLGLVLGGIALADLIRLRQLRTPGVERRVTHTLPLGVWSPVQLTLTNRTGEPLRLDLHDVHPPELASRDLPAALRLAGHERRRLSYRVRPPRRGDLRFSACDLGLISPAGLWAQRRRVPLADAVRVFPNFAEISRYTLLASHDQLSQLGVRRLQRRGTGAEFHQLREYRAGDELRQIDWKATSRLRKPIAREYQDERDQRLLVLLDCGRRMRHEDAGREAGTREVPVSHLDEALNALVLLAYLHGGPAVASVAELGLSDPDDRVRLVAAKALPGLEEPVALRKLVDVAISGRNPWPVRRAACAGICGMVSSVSFLPSMDKVTLASRNVPFCKFCSSSSRFGDFSMRRNVVRSALETMVARRNSNTPRHILTSSSRPGNPP